jgi:uncharacterized linocin/CFP29 family protein
MHSDLVEVGWSEEQWNLIVTAVTEEAQRARVAAQALPVTGPESPTVVSVPKYRLSTDENNPAPPPKSRLAVDSEPDLHLTRISVNVYLRTHEAADLELKAALVMFRRAANLIARVEDALVFNGRDDKGAVPYGVLTPEVIEIGGHGTVEGLFDVRSAPVKVAGGKGPELVNKIVETITKLEERGQLGPYACILGNDLFAEINNPTDNLVLPRDRVLPFLGGPLLRSSAIRPNLGTVVALSGAPIELVVATDIGVRYLQTSLEPRFVFRVSERVALRIKDEAAVGILEGPIKPGPANHAPEKK